MNVLFASTDYIEPGRSSTGLPNYLKRISSILISNGDRAIVVYGALYNQHRFDNGIEIYAVRIPMKASRGGDDASVARVRCLITGYYINKKIESIIQEQNIDIIQFASICGIGIFYNGVIPAVVRLSSYAKIAYSSSYNTLSADCIKTYSELEIEAGKHIGNVFGPSEVTASVYEKDLGRKVEVVESPFFPVNNIDEKIYEDLLDKKTYVLFFGKMYAEKGIIELCEILEAFLQQNTEFLFVFVGSDSMIKNGSAYSLIKKKAGKYIDRVIILSELKHSQLFSIVSHAKFVVLPSYMENLSNACMEAMYYNGCVVATKDAGFEQLIEDGISGYLVPKFDTDALLNALNHVADLDESHLISIRDNARSRIEKNKPEIIIRDLTKYYETVIEKWHVEDHSVQQNYYTEVDKYINKEYMQRHLIEEADKRYLNSRLFSEWARKLVYGKDPIDSYFRNMKSLRIAVYGMMELGRLLVDSLKKNGIKVCYTIDSNIEMRYKEYPIFRPCDDLPSVDIIVVTPIIYFEEILKSLDYKTTAKIISIEDVILE